MKTKIVPTQEFQDIEYQPWIFTRWSCRIFHPDQFCKSPEDVENLFSDLKRKEPTTAIGRVMRSMKNFIFGNRIIINTVVKYWDWNVNINNK